MADKMTLAQIDLSEFTCPEIDETLRQRPPAAFSVVDIASLMELIPSNAPNDTCVAELLAEQHLELLLQVLIFNGSRSCTLRALIDTGAKVSLLINTGILHDTVAAANPLNLVTANGTPMRGGQFGAEVTLKIPIAVPHKKKMVSHALTLKNQWAYEADIKGVDMIIGYPLMVVMHLVPIPS